MTEYEIQKAEAVRLGLMIGASSNPDPIARRCLAQSKQKDIAEARAAYLAENGIEKVKAAFPRMWREIWPGLH